MTVAADLRFELPAGSVAVSPPEARGLRRDDVRLLVADPSGVAHARFHELPQYLQPGDLIVVNVSPTMPAAVTGFSEGRRVDVHFSTWHNDGTWTVELRRPDRSGPVLDAAAGQTVKVRGGAVTLLQPSVGDRAVRLWRARAEVRGGMRRFLARHGRPVRYRYVPEHWPLEAYQTIFANRCMWPASAEMASAARPFTNPLVSALRARGVGFASIVLHTGVSSLEAHEPPVPERFEVPAAAADAVNAAKRRGGRVVAVGTTVTRALESAADPWGGVDAATGWTDLILGPDRTSRVVDGLITGWHPPGASHLDLLHAVAGHQLVRTAYEAALDAGYLWHEFGDSCLFLPG